MSNRSNIIHAEKMENVIIIAVFIKKEKKLWDIMNFPYL